MYSDLRLRFNIRAREREVPRHAVGSKLVIGLSPFLLLAMPTSPFEKQVSMETEQVMLSHSE